MNDVKWIKLSTDIFDNRKIKQIQKLPDGYAIVVVWVKILCLAGCVNRNGDLMLTDEIAYTDQTLATEFDMPLPTIQAALDIFERFGMVEVTDNILCVKNWAEYQSADGLDKIREQNRLRNQKYRERKKIESGDVTHDVTMTQSSISISDSQSVSNSNSNNIIKGFQKPTLSELQHYIREKGYHVDAEAFIAFYESNGWKVGKNPMKSWQSALVTWEKRESKTAPKQSTFDRLLEMGRNGEFDD